MKRFVAVAIVCLMAVIGMSYAHAAEYTHIPQSYKVCEYEYNEENQTVTFAETETITALTRDGRVWLPLDALNAITGYNASVKYIGLDEAFYGNVDWQGEYNAVSGDVFYVKKTGSNGNDNIFSEEGTDYVDAEYAEHLYPLIVDSQSREIKIWRNVHIKFPWNTLYKYQKMALYRGLFRTMAASSEYFLWETQMMKSVSEIGADYLGTETAPDGTVLSVSGWVKDYGGRRGKKDLRLYLNMKHLKFSSDAIETALTLHHELVHVLQYLWEVERSEAEAVGEQALLAYLMGGRELMDRTCRAFDYEGAGDYKVGADRAKAFIDAYEKRIAAEQAA